MKLTNLFTIAAITSVVVLSGCTKSADTSNNTKIAECLTTQGATMYGTNRCSHCQAQKALFGMEAFTKVNFVDCDKETNVCSLAWVEGYPTWKFADGSTLVGEQTFEALTAAAWCSLDGSVVTPVVAAAVSGDVATGVVDELTGTQETITGDLTVSTGN